MKKKREKENSKKSNKKWRRTSGVGRKKKNEISKIKIFEGKQMRIKWKKDPSKEIINKIIRKVR